MAAPSVPNRDRISVSPAAIDPGDLIDAVTDPSAGAVVLFLGTVRDHAPGRSRVTSLEYEAYEEVVERRIAEVVAEARRLHPVLAVAVAHRVGVLSVGEVSVGVAVSSGHRPEAFAAARRIIDGLKSTAPIWKKETWEGGAEWVEGG